MNDDKLPSHCRAVVAIPACDEEDRIGACLAALAVQRDRRGAPLPSGSFAVLVLANNCRDATASHARSLTAACPFHLRVVEARLPAEQSNAGGARKQAMDAAAASLETAGPGGILLTTDADSRVDSTWLYYTLESIAAGADAVAGYIEAEPSELMRLGPAFLHRGRLEDTFLAAMAEILALCDPVPHDPWPNHRVASGASFGVTLAAYRAVGGLPPKALGEDVALAEALTVAGFKLRHRLDVTVTTSCRLDGRAAGGAADTMRLRHEKPDTACDADMEPIAAVVRRFAWKGRMRRWHRRLDWDEPAWSRRIGLDWPVVTGLARAHPLFEAFWRVIEAESPLLRRQPALRPSQLPAEIARAERALRWLRLRASTHGAATLAPPEQRR